MNLRDQIKDFIDKFESDVVICFDYFDTVVHRSVYPEATKKLAAKKLSLSCGTEISAREIYESRAQAERELCSLNEAEGHDLEFNLVILAAKMYDQFNERFKVSKEDFIELFLDFEVQIEKEVQVINDDVFEAIKYASDKGHEIILVSDFYLGYNELNALLKHHKIDHFFRKVFISSEFYRTKSSGRLYEIVREEIGCPFDKMAMIGDNAHSDVAMAESKGIHALWLDRLAQQNKYRHWQTIHQNEFQSLKLFLTEVDELYRDGESLKTIFPEMSSALWLFCHLLFIDASKRKLQNIFFLSKEGEFLKKLFELYQNKVFGKQLIKSHYLIVSRKATFITSLSSLTTEDFCDLFNYYRNISPKEFLLSLNLAENVASDLCQKLSIDFEKRDADFPTSEAFLRIKKSPQFEELFENHRFEQRAILNRYIRSFGVDFETEGLTIVDVGWKGSIQNNIFKALKQNVKCLGYYIGLLNPTMLSENNEKVGILFSSSPSKSQYFDVYNNNRSLFEIVLGATHGSANGYLRGDVLDLEEHTNIKDSRADSEGEFHILVQDLPEERSLYNDMLKPLQGRIFNEVGKLSAIFSICKSTSICNKFFAKKYARLVFLPKTWEVEFFERLYHLENFGVFEFSEFKRSQKLSLEERLKNLREVTQRSQEILETGIWPPIILRKMGLDHYRRIDGSRRMKKEFGDDRARKKIAFLLGYPEISGGTNVIFEHATFLNRNDYEVTIITEQFIEPVRYSWHRRAHELRWLTFESASHEQFDIVFATWWYSAFDLYRVNSKKFCYFVQSIESKFFPSFDDCSSEQRASKELCHNSYLYPLPIITEATWIKNYLEQNYNHNVQLVHNGIVKEIYENVQVYSKPTKGKLRVLLEGALGVPMKNIDKTLEICKKSNADEIWLLTPTDVESVEGIDRVFSRIPMKETPAVYGSCDVIVKLSYVEGMFGPPLEMFHCGGTAIIYDVTGYDEYIEHDVNALVAKTDDDETVLRYINLLKENPEKLEELKKGAIETAQKWIDWDESSKRYENAILNLDSVNTVNKSYLEKLTENFKTLYDFTKNRYEKELSDKIPLEQVQVFWSEDQSFCEKKSTLYECISSKPISIKHDIVGAGERLYLRIDPSMNSNRLIKVESMKIVDKKRNRIKYDFTCKGYWPSISGTAKDYSQGKCLGPIFSNGSDPQLLLPAIKLRKNRHYELSLTINMEILS